MQLSWMGSLKSHLPTKSELQSRLTQAGAPHSDAYQMDWPPGTAGPIDWLRHFGPQSVRIVLLKNGPIIRQKGCVLLPERISPSCVTSARYADLVYQLELENRQNPIQYRNRLLALAALGYGYIFAILLGLIALMLAVLGAAWISGSGTILAIQVAIAIGILIWFVVRVLLFRINPPAGRHLARHEAPRLFEEVEEMCSTLHTPPIDHVILKDEMNAAMARVPRFGLFGWPTNYLILGLPLLSAMTAEEFRSVIAHELGHHSRSHGKFMAWIYRLRESWFVLVDSLEQAKHWGSFLFRPFFQWYAPYFGAWSFVLARQQEYEADAIASNLTSPEIATSALLRLNLVVPVTEEKFWPQVFQQAAFTETPPDRVFFLLERLLERPIDEYEARSRLAHALRVATDLSDTHPSLKDRLLALDASLTMPQPIAASAGRHFLDPSFDRLLEEASAHWRDQILPLWPQIREEQTTLRTNYQQLREAADTSSLPAPKGFELAQLVEQFDGRDAAIDAYEAVLAIDPNHIGALTALGRLRLERGDRSGLDSLRQVAATDQLEALEATGRIIAFHRSMDEPTQAREYLDLYDRHLLQHEQARTERARLNPKDHLEPHGLSQAPLTRLAEQLARNEAVNDAWLARKKLNHFPELPLYILGINPSAKWWQFRSQHADERLVQELASSLHFVGETFVITKQVGGDGGLFKRLQATPDSQIFSRTNP